MSKSAAYDDFPWLTAQDVQLLYSIIEHAENSPEPPFRALFAAYDSTLAEHGISKAHDQKYLRFLLRMGELRNEAKGLFEQFQLLLSKLNIEVDFGGDGKTDVAFAGRRAEPNVLGEQQSSDGFLHPEEQQVARARPLAERRTSFESGYDNIAERSPALGSVGSPARPQSTDLVEARAHSRDDSRSRDRNVMVESTGKENRRSTIESSRPAKRRVSFSEVQSGPQAQIRRLSDEEDVDITTSRSDADDEYESSDAEPAVEVIVPVSLETSLQRRRITRQEYMEMKARARTLREHHSYAKALMIFRHWKASADSLHRKHTMLEAAAVARDNRTLERQALDLWLFAHRTRQHEKETQRFFDGLEQRAGAARDMFLIQKAFTHWAQSAEDEVNRASAARRHILRTRYFNAWRDNTVVNELKVRRMVLGRFIKAWKNHTAQLIHQEDEALNFRDSKLQAAAYRSWFWHFCERRAPFWYDAKRSRSVFGLWNRALGVKKEQEAVSNSFRNSRSLRTVLYRWTAKMAALKQKQDEAETFRKRNLVLPILENVRREIQLAPSRTELETKVVSRVARDCLQIWHKKTAMSQRAAALDKMRIVGKAWTAWNNKLRCQTLQKKIDARVATEALYKWVIAGRLALLERVKSERLKMNALARWKLKTKTTAAVLERGRESVEASRTQRLMRKLLVFWLQKTKGLLENQRRAESFHNQHLCQHSLQVWTSRQAQQSKMLSWAKDASFYIQAHTALKTWRSATEASQRQKRRDAFAQMRGRMKSVLVRKTWQAWRAKLLHAYASRAKADEFAQEQLKSRMPGYLLLWYDRSADIAQTVQQAEAHDGTRLLQRHMRAWSRRYEVTQRAQDQAVAFYADTTNASAATILRDMNWKLFQIKRHLETAGSLVERNQKKHFRNMLRFWAQRTQHRREGPGTGAGDGIDQPEDEGQDETESIISHDQRVRTTSLRPSPRRNLNRNGNLPLSRNKPSFSQSVGAGPVPNVTIPAITPGYLRTPSRRTVRLFATTSKPTPAFTIPATPATTQLTPFISRLRAAQGSEPRARPGNHGRATADFTQRLTALRDEVVFPDIPESSPP